MPELPPPSLDEIHQVKAAEPDIHVTAEDRCVRLAAGIRKIRDLGRIAADHLSELGGRHVIPGADGRAGLGRLRR